MTIFQLIVFIPSCAFLILFVYLYLNAMKKRNKTFLGRSITEEEFIANSRANRAIIIVLIFLYIAAIIWGIDGPPKSKDQHYQENPTESFVLTWNYNGEVDPDLQVELLEEILGDFYCMCKGLSEHPTAVESAKVSVTKLLSWPTYQQETHNWGNVIEANIVIKKDADLPWPRLNGHTLYYFIGGGENPGIDIMKDESALFFGLNENEFNANENNFVPAEVFRKVDSLYSEDK